VEKTILSEFGKEATGEKNDAVGAESVFVLGLTDERAILVVFSHFKFHRPGG